MNLTHVTRKLILVTSLYSSRFTAPFLFAQGAPQAAMYPDYPSETPSKLDLATEIFDYVRREVMIPMRDGVKLHTIILVPKGAKNAAILLTRTPYDATKLTT